MVVNSVTQEAANSMVGTAFLWCMDPNGSMTQSIGDEFAQVWELPQELSLSNRWLDYVLREDRTSLISCFQEVGRGESYQTNYRIQAGGTIKWICERGHMIFDQYGEPVQLVRLLQQVEHPNAVSSHQMTTSGTADNDSSDNNESVPVISQEMVKLARAASHDLLQPLRGISCLAEWIGQDSPDLSQESLNHLALITSRTKRLETLIHDLREFFFLGQDPETPLECELPTLVSRALDELKRLSSRLIIEYASGSPRIRVETQPLTMVLKHLLSNAAKHTGKTPCLVRVSMQVHESMLHVELADDGQGVPLEQHERVFEPFHTLRPKDEVEGSGLGLAIARRVVERHGGQISLGTGANGGCHVSFTWGLQPM